MTLEIGKLLDETGWRLLQALQQDARLSFTELGQRVGLSSPAVADRVHKIEEAGIIRGYHAEVDFAKLGLPVLAIIRLGHIGGQSCSQVASQVSAIPEVLELYRIIGSDSMVVTVVAASVDHLARIIDELSVYGIPASSIVRSHPMKRHVLGREVLERGEGGDDVALPTKSSGE